ncbi:MAG: VWA domain-containing protein [Anaerolineales bacterium]|nr:VWA domain-containing protein [Anaerolineales bacterium]
MAGELNLTVTLHRLIYQVMPTPQQAYVLLEALPTAAAPGSGTQPVNFSLVLDRSGSMAGEKLRHMKEAACLVVDHLGAGDLLSVVVFDDAQPADLIVPSGAVQDREMVKRKIGAIQERGGTHMSTGMSLGLRELQRGQSPSANYVARVNGMLLLTDGQTWEDEDKCRQLADQCRSEGIPIYVLGMGVGAGSDWDPRLLEDLAQRSGGEWVMVDQPEKVGAIFEKTLQAMQGTAVTNAQLTMRLVEGVSPRFVWRVTPLISRLDHHAVSAHDVQVFLGDIQHGVGQSILADLLLPPRQAGTFRLLQADITYDVPGSELTGQRVSAEMVVPFTDDAAQANQTQGRVMNIIERVVAHKLQTQALDEAAAGDVARATQRLRAAATRLLELGEEDMAAQANQQAEQIEQSGQIDLAAAQKMRYATKRLTETDE